MKDKERIKEALELISRADREEKTIFPKEYMSEVLTPLFVVEKENPNLFRNAYLNDDAMKELIGGRLALDDFLRAIFFRGVFLEKYASGQIDQFKNLSEVEINTLIDSLQKNINGGEINDRPAELGEKGPN